MRQPAPPAESASSPAENVMRTCTPRSATRAGFGERGSAGTLDGVTGGMGGSVTASGSRALGAGAHPAVTRSHTHAVREIACIPAE